MKKIPAGIVFAICVVVLYVAIIVQCSISDVGVEVSYKTIYAADFVDEGTRLAFASGVLATRCCPEAQDPDSIAEIQSDYVTYDLPEAGELSGVDSCVLNNPQGSFRAIWSMLSYDMPSVGKVQAVWGTDTATWIEDGVIDPDFIMLASYVIKQHISADSLVLIDSVRVVNGVMHIDFLLVFKNYTGQWNSGTDIGFHLVWPGIRYVPMLQNERRLFFGPLATGNTDECEYVFQQCPSWTGTSFWSAQLDTASAISLYNNGILFNCKTGVDKCDLRNQYMDSTILAQMSYQLIFPEL